MTHGEQRSAKLAYGLNEVYGLLGVGRTTIYQEIKAGRLRVTKVGRRSLILADDLAAYLATLKKGPAQVAAAVDSSHRNVRITAESKAPASRT